MGRTKLQKQRDKRRVSQAYLQGETQAEIAASLGLSQPTVSRILKDLQADWMAAAIGDVTEAKARELAKIDTLELEYWAAWKRSQQNAEVETTKMQGTDPSAPGKLEKQKRVEGQVGDSRYLQGVQWCVEMRCKIIGIEAPRKIAPTDPTGEKQYEPKVNPYLTMSKKELQELARKMLDGDGND